MEKDLIVIGDAIRLERLKRKLSQDKFAELVGLKNAQHVVKIEHGDVNMKISTLFAILRALDLNLEDLIDLKK